MQRILLVRHCESSGQAPDAPLTARGAEQARALADFLDAHDVDHVASSPYLRARQTIEPFARRRGLPIAIHDGLRERTLSGEPVAHWREVVARSFEEPAYCVAGGESGAETLARGWSAIDAVLRGGHGLPVVTSHGQLLSLVLHSIDASFGFAGWERLSNPDVFLVEVSGPAGSFARVWK
jgi:2,3-bisphosphoglycerate-dependent phosphoglycerate mutase